MRKRRMKNDERWLGKYSYIKLLTFELQLGYLMTKWKIKNNTQFECGVPKQTMNYYVKESLRKRLAGHAQ